MQASKTVTLPGFAGWRMVAIAFLAQNCAIGLTTGSYGAVLPSLQRELGTSRAAASSALGVMLMTLGLLSPVVGHLLQRVPVRAAMVAGALLNAVGYVLLAYANSLFLVIGIFAVFIGPGACLLGIIPASTLVTRWFEGDRGKALGITNMPFFLLLVPPAAALLVEHGGRKLLFLALAAAFLVIMPILRQIVEAPDRIGQVPRGRVSSSALKAVLGNRAGLMSSRAIFRNSKFWLLSIGMGILTGSGIAFVTHFIAIVSGKGIASAAAALPLSSYGAGTLVGALFFGWLIDRVGPLASLAINTAVQAGLWFLLISVSDFSMLVVIAGLIGAGLGAAVALHGAALNEILGSINFSRGMGFSYLIKVPFLFGAAPLAGYFYDRSNNYNFALLFYGACLALSSVIFAVLAFSRKRPAQAALLAG